jgi:hypothetical protein
MPSFVLRQTHEDHICRGFQSTVGSESAWRPTSFWVERDCSGSIPFQVKMIQIDKMFDRPVNWDLLDRERTRRYPLI